MTGLPTLLVKLDDGTGTFPYDVSSFVRLPDGLSITRGRTDEFNQVQPSNLSLVFDNTTGVFTLGSGTYGIVIDQRIQVTETVSGAVKRFTGYVQDWPVAWPDGSDQFAVAQVTAVDRLSRLARRKLRSTIENEIMVDSPSAYYTLGEPEGATQAADTSGNVATRNLATPLVLAGDATLPVVFGNATGPGTDGLTAAQFAGGQYLSGSGQLASTNFTLEAFFSCSTPPATSYAIAQSGAAVLGIDSTGHAFVLSGGTSTSASPNVCDGAVHHLALVKSSGLGSAAYLDGVSFVPPAFSGSSGDMAVGAPVPNAFVGAVSHVALFPSLLSAARVAAHAAAGFTGFATDTADARIARLASYGNIPTAEQSLEAGQQSSIAAQSTTGQSVFDAMQAVAAAEGGLVFIRGDGNLVMQNKSHRVLKATGAAALTLAAIDINPDVTLGGAKNYLYNTATGARDGGAPQRSVNAAGVTANEEYPIDLSNALLPTDELVLNILTWTSTLYSTPRPRLPSVTLDLLTLSAATVQSVLALEIGDLITITGLPSQTPASLGSLLVEGWTETLTHDSWQVTLNTVPADLFKAWILDSATYSVLDSTTRLYF